MNLSGLETTPHKKWRSTLQQHYEVILVFITGFLLRLYMAYADPFLNHWDERFHALVAKNMMKDPLRPILIAEPLNTWSTGAWCCSHIWLHKQPLFMWQMALSMKLFGVSEYAIRYPSVLMGSLMIVLVYRIALLMNQSKLTALIAALLMCLSHYQLELTAGRLGMDHNDIAFGFYTLASIWSYFEYTRSRKWYWAVLAGLFSGCAILNKWLTGLLVFSVWGIWLIISFFRERQGKTFLHFGAALIACIAVALPWQLFILNRYPEETRYEYAYNTKHIWETVEGHGGGYAAYLSQFPAYFGPGICWLIVPGLLLLLLYKPYRNERSVAAIAYTLIVFIFFSFIAQTKLASYFFVVAPLCLIFLAVPLATLLSRIRKFRIIRLVLLLPVLYYSLDMADLLDDQDSYLDRNKKIHNTLIYKNLSKTIPSGIHIISNIDVNSFENIDVLFYNDRFACYWWLNDQDVSELEKKHVRLAAFDRSELPDYIRHYPYLYLIPQQLQ